jgi:hypothetical protein
MVVGIAVTIWVVLALVSFTRPRFGAVLIWFLHWNYPNTLLFGLMPLNTRFDDLWVVFLFVVCLISPQSRKATGPLVWLGVAWWLSIMVGSLAGLLVTGMEAWESTVKLAVKALYVPLTAYILSNLLHTREQLDRHMRWMCVAAVVAGAIAIAAVYAPDRLEAFLPRIHESGLTGVEEVEYVADVEARRAGGSLGVVRLGVVVLGISLLSLAMVVYRAGLSARVFYAIMCGGSLVALAYTISRGSIAGLIAGVGWAIMFARRKATFVLVAVAGLVVMLFQGGLLQRVLQRFSGGASPYATTFAEGLEVRLEIVRMFLQDFSAAFFLTGIGMPTVFAQRQATAHNTYLGAMVYTGVLGLVVLFLLIRQGIVLGRMAARVKSDRMAQGLGTCLLMLVVAMMVNGLAIENFQNVTAMQLYFAMMIFVEQRLAQLRAAQPAPLMNAPLAAPPPLTPVSSMR